jgi:transposase
VGGVRGSGGGVGSSDGGCSHTAHLEDLLIKKVIDSVATGVSAALSELVKLGRTLGRRAAQVLAYFDRAPPSNGPAEAINGRLEHLRGSALGFRNLTNYIARSLLEADGFKPRLHPGS